MKAEEYYAIEKGIRIGREEREKEILKIIKEKRGKMCGNNCCDCLRLVEETIKLYRNKK